MNGPSFDGPDHAERRRAVAHGAVDLLPLVEVMQEGFAIARQRLTDEIGVVAVGDITDALGEERVLDLDFL
jgi:hypothetical protein